MRAFRIINEPEFIGYFFPLFIAKGWRIIVGEADADNLTISLEGDGAPEGEGEPEFFEEPAPDGGERIYFVWGGVRTLLDTRKAPPHA